MAKYMISPVFATLYYGQPEKAPKGWYIAVAKNKDEAVKIFAKRYNTPLKWVRDSRIQKL